MSDGSNGQNPTQAAVAAQLRQILDREVSRRNERSEFEKEREELRALKAEFDSMRKALLGQKDEDPLVLMRNEMQTLQHELMALKQEREMARRNAMLEDVRTQVATKVRSLDGYELVKATGAEKLVSQMIEDHFRTTGEVLSEAAAAKIVEDQLSAQVDKVLQLESVKKRIVGGATQGSSTPAPTLTNDLSGTVPTRTETPEPRGLPSEDEIRAAVAKLGSTE